MGINFNIIEQSSTIPYEEIKQDYIKGLRGEKLRKKYDLGISRYLTILKDFRDEGIPTTPGGDHKEPRKKFKYYRKCTRRYKNKQYVTFKVQRMINRELYTFGIYKTEREARERVEELKQNNWEGLL